MTTTEIAYRLSDHKANHILQELWEDEYIKGTTPHSELVKIGDEPAGISPEQLLAFQCAVLTKDRCQACGVLSSSDPYEIVGDNGYCGNCEIGFYQ